MYLSLIVALSSFNEEDLVSSQVKGGLQEQSGDEALLGLGENTTRVFVTNWASGGGGLYDKLISN